MAVECQGISEGVPIERPEGRLQKGGCRCSGGRLCWSGQKGKSHRQGVECMGISCCTRGCIEALRKHLRESPGREYASEVEGSHVRIGNAGCWRMCEGSPRPEIPWNVV